MHMTENKENTNWYLTQLKLTFGNNTHTGIAESCLAGQGETRLYQQVLRSSGVLLLLI